MSTILVCSIFRDLVHHPNWEQYGGSPLAAYLHQVETMEQVVAHMGHTVRFSFFENDSMDETPQKLHDWLQAKPGRGVLTSLQMGKPRFRSLPAQNTPERITHLSEYRNQALSKYDGEDWVLFLEADILYAPETIHYLLSGSLGDIRSPLSFFHPHDLTTFYDPLSTRDLVGTRYRSAWPPPPTEEDMKLCIHGQPIEVSTTFNCFCLMKGDVLKAGVQFSFPGEGESEATGLCGAAKAKGFRIFVYPAIRYSVVHPLANHPWSENS